MEQDIASIRQAIRDIPDFPKPGIVFKDITPLLSNGPLFRKTIDIFAARYRSQKIDTVLGIESRGFIIGCRAGVRSSAPDFALCASRESCPMKPTRRATRSNTAPIPSRFIAMRLPNNARVVIADDLLATGGTAAATAELVTKLGGTVVECAFVIELAFLKGRDRLKPYGVFSLLQYDSE